ncbi:MAG: BRO family protein [Cellvibrionaceae bacterium]|nr:BRO family protein [Cellvibrionaceae bacterium]
MSNIKLFQNQQIRSHWDAEREQWLFSVIDVVGALTGSANPRKYWSVLKTRLKKEGSQLATKCSQLKMPSADGKSYRTDVANTETLLRLLQSIPSPKAEPFKLWLAQVGYERLEENEDPELTIDRALATYLAKGYTKEWINQRLKSIEVRKELTDEWEARGVSKAAEFAILTDEITRAWSGLTTKAYKQHKNLKKENLRDNMTNLELVLNMLAEATTTEISKEIKPATFDENKKVAKQGGDVAGNARKDIESKTGKSVISRQNAKSLGRSQKPELPETE